MVQVFNVLTEFRFEVGSAVLGTQKLQSAVEGVSQAADSALVGFQKLSMGAVASLGLGEGGLLGILYTGIKSFDKFRQSQIAFANVLGSGSGPFEQRMLASAEIMEKMNKLANEFALPVDDLVSMTKVLGPLLNSKGLAGPQFSGAIDMSRNLLKSAPTLGVDPQLVQGQLMRMIEGHADSGDTLFNRLTGDTKTMKPFLGNSKGFNGMDEAKRVQTIQKALKEFASDTKVLEANVNTLRGQMTLFNNAVAGTFSIFRSLGEVLMKPLLILFKAVNAFLLKEGAQTVKNFAKGLAPLIESPERLLATMLQLRKLKSDVKLAGTIVALVGAFIGLNHIMHLFGINLLVLAARMTMASLAAAGVIGGGALKGIVMILMNFIRIGSLITAILGPIALLVFLFQLISRAIAIAQINDAKNLLAMAPRIAELTGRIMRIVDVFIEGFDKIAEFISPLFQMSMWFELLADSIDNITIAVAILLGGFQGLVFGILETFNQMKSLFTGGGFSFSAIGDAVGAGAEQMIERILGKIDNNEGAIANMTTNIAKVEIKNDFKEQQEPDRIAFTLKDQLLKAAQNPTQRRGGGFAASTVGGGS